MWQYRGISHAVNLSIGLGHSCGIVGGLLLTGGTPFGCRSTTLDPYNLQRIARPYSCSCRTPMTVFPTAICPQAEAPPLDTTDPGSAEKATVNDTPEPEGDMKEGVNSMPPILEEFIPGERLPDIIDVYVNKEFLLRTSGNLDFLNRSSPQLERPIKFVRQHPERTVIDKGILDLRCFDYLGTGSHSTVFLAPLTLPSTTPKPSVRGAVAVKLSDPHNDQCEMLMNEAKIYDAFPPDLQRGDVPIVPKFYGCYAPYIKLSDRVNNGNGGGNLDKEGWTRETMPKCMSVPILLLEACGRAVRSSLSDSGRESIGTLLEHLHEVRFVQGSMYHRNVLVQPGPLTVPRANRSLDEPSYRIIDFGRGISFGVNTSSLKDVKREIEREERHARSERLIPY
ncbi:hypothetical protein F5888DRAFT_1732125 [Russula emetica]|nr:hypothetical protein F5888DRAFT_1732125 [Russula emetica]